MIKIFFVVVLFLFFLIGCTNQNQESSSQQKSDQKTSSSEFVGKWRSFSDTKNTQVLELRSDGTWTLSTSNGRWRVEPIQDTDWVKWGGDPDGSTRKIVFENWNNQVADGPVQETEEGVDFFFIIYNVTLETYGESVQVQLKYGHSRWD